jgi:uncharacterized protein (TIGR02598 family)
MRRSCSFSPRLKTAAKRKAAGFSMIELVLALGVVSFAFVSLLGLLPIGMATFRNALDVSVGMQISQRIVNETQETDFSDCVDPTKKPVTRYFDDQGEEVSDSSKAIYQVNVRIESAPSLPGTEEKQNENLATVTVQVANNPAGKVLTSGVDGLWAEETGVTMVYFSSIIAGNQATL